MRDIRFRVFDKVSGKISDPFALFGEFTLLGAVFTWLSYVRHAERICCGLRDLNDLTIMQYTGIKDKEGKEIYEGDILLFASKSESETFVREVKFEDGAFVVDVDDQCGMYLGGICTNENHEGSHTGFVIGNIYQNPELLQES